MTLNSFEIIFNIMFTFEFIVKLLALSYQSYFRSAWNKLDFVVLAMGWLPSIISVVARLDGQYANISAVRAIRVLKLLRTANSTKGMKQVISGILHAIPRLLHTLYLFFFGFTVVGVLFVKLYGGVLRQGCYIPTTSHVFNNDTNSTSLQTVWNLDASGTVCTMAHPGYEDRYYCPQEGARCSTENPGTRDLNPTGTNNHVGFDNFPIAILSIFQIITLEGWVDIMYSVQDSEGTIHCALFISIVMFGSFFMVNLLIGVIFENYSEAMKEFKHLESQRKSTEPWTGSHPNNAKPSGACTTAAGTTQKKGFRTSIFGVVNDPRFSNFILLLIFLNTVILAIEHDDPARVGESQGINTTLQATLDALNSIFSIMFLIEMMMKHIGFGFKKYWTNPMDAFDGLIVVISCADMVVSSAEAKGTSAGAISVFRAFRLLRVFKVVRKWRRLHSIIIAITKSAQGLLNFLIVLTVIMVIYALVGMEIFGGKYMFHGLDPLPRNNFNSLFWALITVFQVLTGENWNDVMHDHMEISAFWSVLFFVSLFCIGNYILMNIFLAILLQNFDQSELIALVEKKERIRVTLIIDSQTDIQPNRPSTRGRRRKSSIDLIGLENMELADRKKIEQELRFHKTLKGDMQTGRTLNYFTANHPVRKKLLLITSSKVFDHGILVVILVSSVLLALEEPRLKTGSTPEQPLFTIDLIVSMIFVVECIMKCIACGVYGTRLAYLKSGWNVLDFLIILISITNIALSSLPAITNLGFLKTLRVLRAVRPLRAAKFFGGVKRVIETIVESLPGVGNLLLIVMLFLLIFGILGVQLFKGGLYYCQGSPADYYALSYTECRGMFIDEQGRNASRTWRNRPENFDNALHAIVTLFGITTLEMWPDIMGYCVDMTQRGEHPVKNYSPLVALYFVAVIIVCTIVITNLFVGVVVDSFQIVKAREDGTSSLSEGQTKWLNTMKLMITSKPEKVVKPLKGGLLGGKFREQSGLILDSSRFNKFILYCIVGNTFSLMLHWWHPPGTPPPKEWTLTVKIVEYTFLFIFTIEAALKQYTYGLHEYFDTVWNVMDFGVVLGGIISVVASGLRLSTDISFLHTISVLRVLRVLRSLESVQVLVTTMIYSLPSVSNVSSLLLLFYFIFSIIGMNLFGDVPLDGDFYNRHSNFRDVGNGILLLFRCTTGESWNGIMDDLIIAKGHGTPEAFFVAFVVGGTMILANVLVAVILDNFTDLMNSDNAIIQKEDIRQFAIEWGKLVVEAQHEEDCFTSIYQLMIKSNGTEEQIAGNLPDADSVLKNLSKSFRGRLVPSMSERNTSFTSIENRAASTEQTGNEQLAQRNYLSGVHANIRDVFKRGQSHLGTLRKLRRVEAVSKKYLPVHLFHKIFEQLTPPFGFKGVYMPNKRVYKARIRKHIRRLHIPIREIEGSGPCIFFFEAIVACAGIHFKPEEIDVLQQNDIIQARLRAKLRKRMPEYVDIGKDTHVVSGFLGEIESAAYVLQKTSRHFLATRRMQHRAAKKITAIFRKKLALRRFYNTIAATQIQRCFRASLVRRSRHQTKQIEELKEALAFSSRSVFATPDFTRVHGSLTVDLNVPLSSSHRVRSARLSPRRVLCDSPSKTMFNFAATVIQRYYRQYKRIEQPNVLDLMNRLAEAEREVDRRKKENENESRIRAKLEADIEHLMKEVRGVGGTSPTRGKVGTAKHKLPSRDGKNEVQNRNSALSDDRLVVPRSNDLLSQLRVCIVSANQSAHVTYMIHVAFGEGKTWTTNRRYSEFSFLHDTLTSTTKQVSFPSLPSKSLWSLSSNGVEKRRIGLELYLQALIKIREVWTHREMPKFLDNTGDHFLETFLGF